MANRRLIPGLRYQYFTIKKRKGRTYHVTAGFRSGGHLTDFFLECGKPDSEAYHSAENDAALVSLLLQLGVDKEIVLQLVSGLTAAALELSFHLNDAQSEAS